MSMSRRSRIKFAHTVVGGSEVNVDLYLDNAPLYTNLSYLAMTEYIVTSPGNHKIDVNAAGTQNSLLSLTFDLQSEGSYTAVLHGRIEIPYTINMTILFNDIKCPPEGSAHIRMFHSGPYLPPLDIYTNGILLYSNIKYGEVAGNHYISIRAPEFNLEVKGVGGYSLLPPSPLKVGPSKVYTIIFTGRVDDPLKPFTILLNEESASRCVHL